MIHDSNIAGLDEAGRGPWAGPVCVAVVKLKQEIDGLNDSKKLTEKTREKLYKQILSSGSKIGIGWASAQEIDSLGINPASNLAAARALENSQILDSCSLIIDGNFNYLNNRPNTKTLIKADGKITSVAAASIIAKVSRDRYMLDANDKFPNYGFAAHKGYGTKLHKEALIKAGTCQEHRLSFKPVAAIYS